MNHSGHHMGHGGHMSNMSMMSTGSPHIHHAVPGGDHSNHNMGSMDHGGHGGHDHMGMDMGNHSMGHMMMMYFHTGVSEFVLFEKCQTSNKKEMIAACVVIFIAAILYEGLKFLREVLLQRSLRDRSRSYYPDSKMGSPASSQDKIVGRGGADLTVWDQMFTGSHGVQTVLHVVQVFISYCLMLVFMTYNVWLCVAVILGAGVGYFLFGWKRAVVVDANEHCH